MLAEAKNAELYQEWFACIQNSEAKDTFRYMIGVAASLSSYTCHPQFKGVIRDFRLIDSSDEQPFSFIVNKRSLLFYFRLPSVRSNKYSFEALQAEFPAARINSGKEWTVRVSCIRDVQRLLQFACLQ